MSQANLELVRRWYAALPDLRDADPRDDGAWLDRAFRDYLDEGYELRLPPGYPEGEPTFRGRAGFTALVSMLRDAWAGWHFEPQRFIDAGSVVVVFVRVVATGRASGMPMEIPDAHVVTVADGRITSTRVYRDRKQALEAAGLAGSENSSMSSANVEIVQRALKARRSEFEGLLDPAVRLDLSERVFNPAVYEGYDGIMQWRAEVGETWGSYRSEPQEFFEGPGVVVVFTQERGRGKGSGVEVQQTPTALLCRLHSDRVNEIRLYHDRERALRDAGITD